MMIPSNLKRTFTILATVICVIAPSNALGFDWVDAFNSSVFSSQYYSTDDSCVQDVSGVYNNVKPVTTYVAVGNIPQTGKQVNTEVFGGIFDSTGAPGSAGGAGWTPTNDIQGGPPPHDSTGVGANGLPLPGTTSFSESGALGNLPLGTKIEITYNGGTVIAEKEDNAAAATTPDAPISLWWETAKLIGLKANSATISIRGVDPATPITPVTGSPNVAPSAGNTCCNTSVTPAGSSGGGGGGGSLSADQLANIQTIIGIAKTLNLGKRGALIGLMVGWDESTMHDLGNTSTGTLASLSSPYADGNGADHDSVGVFQQRAYGGWAPVPGSKDIATAIKYLMNSGQAAGQGKPTAPAAYAAEAFFDFPAGKTDTKALVAVSGWQTMDPGLAAQAVQQSAGNGSNYRKFQTLAQGEVDKYYDSTAPVPLPVPLKGQGTAPGGGSGLPGSSDQCATPAGTGSINGCANPFAKDNSNWGLARTDMGVDYIPHKTLAVYAICDGKIIEATTSSGWPGGGWINYKLTSGPPELIGKCIYVAEQIKPLPGLKIGDTVKAGQQIATAYAQPTYTEWGWTQSPKLNHEPSTPYNGAADGTPMPGGKAFARFLRALGAKTQQDPGPGPLFAGTPCP